MNDRNKVTELLKNYRSYRYAVSNGIAPHVEDETTGGGGGYGPRIPTLYRGSWDASTDDYRRYSRAVRLISGAVEDVLNDEEQSIVRYKYMERNTLTLSQIADKMNMSERRVLYLHKKALKSLSYALMFIDAPEIINLDKILA
ncbi:hypothetical protein MO973_19600 [Paenibacillus sp. TRM 82003]|nr:hypothetical protein [Paenibacillus sp. TRM 82003]